MSYEITDSQEEITCTFETKAQTYVQETDPTMQNKSREGGTQEIAWRVGGKQKGAGVKIN